jgi:hypothetical protein
MAKKKKQKKRLNINISAYKEFVKQRKTAIVISLCNVAILLLLSYLINNQAIFTGEDLNQYAWMEWIKDKCGLSKEIQEKKDAVFINVAYDKQLVERHDEYGMTVGNVDITDRAKLHSFLETLQKTNTYKYIFMDIRFEKGFDSPIDSALFSQIKNMRNIVIANHEDIKLLDPSLSTKTALNDYRTTIIESNFVRYEYVKHGQISVPLFAYRELTGNNIDKHFLFYTCNHRLCYKSLFINSPVEDWSEFNDQDIKMYYNLGNDLLDNYSDKDIALLTKNKYVVIGDMVEDMHDTYSGSKPGSVITYYAFLALLNGEHFVRYSLLFFLGLLYFVISTSLFESSSIIERIPYIRKTKSKFIHFCASLIEYTFLLLIVMIALNMLLGIATSIMLPSIYFAIQKTYINYKREKI